MQLAPGGRGVAVAQWFLAVLLPVWMVIGRAILGAQLGWMVVLGILWGPVLVVLLLVPPIVTLFDAAARRAGGVRQAYAVSMYVVWGALFLSGFAIVDADDAALGSSLVTQWTALSEDVSDVLFLVLLGVALLGWVAAIVAAALGIAAARREPLPVGPPAGPPTGAPA